MAGNSLGSRGYFVYTDDAGVQYAIQQDCDLALAVGNEETVSNLPRLTSSQKRPIKARTILLQSESGLRKEVVVGDPNSAFFTANAATQMMIDGVVFTVTGRKGEQAFFPSLGGCTPEPEPAP